MKIINKNRFKYLRQDELGTGGRTAKSTSTAKTTSTTNEEDDEYVHVPAWKREQEERARAEAYNEEQKRLNAQKDAERASQSNSSTTDNDPNNYQKGGGGYARISRNISPEVLRDYENGQFKGTDIRDFEKAYNKVRRMSNDELNRLREENSKGNYTLEGSIANAMLGMKIGNGEIENIQSAGDTSNTRVARDVIQNKKSGDSNVITETSKNTTSEIMSPEKKESDIKPKEPIKDEDIETIRNEIKNRINERGYTKQSVDFPSIYTAYKNGLFGDPNDPESKRTYGAFLADHIVKTLGNRPVFHAIGNRVDKTTAEDVSGRESLFDEKIKKDWTSQIDRYNKQQDDILQAKTNVVMDNIEKLGGLENAEDVIDFAQTLKSRTPEEINKVIDATMNNKLADSLLTGNISPSDLAFFKNPNTLADYFMILQKNGITKDNLAIMAQSLNNEMMKNNLEIAKSTKWANIINPYLGMLGNAVNTGTNIATNIGGLAK